MTPSSLACSAISDNQHCIKTVLHARVQALQLWDCSIWPHASLLELQPLRQLRWLRLYMLKPTHDSLPELVAALGELCASPGALPALDTVEVVLICGEGEDAADVEAAEAAGQAVEAMLAAAGRDGVKVYWHSQS